jgi:hypothetical protein
MENENGGGAFGTEEPVALVDHAKEQGQELVAQAKQRSGDLMGQVQDQLRSQVDDQATNLGQSLGHIAAAVAQTGEHLRESDQLGLSRYAEDAAHFVDDAAKYLRSADLDRLVTDAEDLARRRPALFLGGLFLIGLAAGRFLRSSGPIHPSSRRDVSDDAFAAAI